MPEPTASARQVAPRPDPRSLGWAAPPPQHALVWSEETDGYWHVPTKPRLCRWKPTGALTSCGAPAVVIIARGAFSTPSARQKPQQWKAYCADHSHGRVVVDGRVYGARIVPIEEADHAVA